MADPGEGVHCEFNDHANRGMMRSVQGAENVSTWQWNQLAEPGQSAIGRAAPGTKSVTW